MAPEHGSLAEWLKALHLECSRGSEPRTIRHPLWSE